jgi:hypothetical protein
MAGRVRHWLLFWLAVAIAALSFPALAASPAFTFCRVSDPGLTNGAAIIKTIRADGQQIFQTSLALPIMQHGDERLRAFLVWPDDVPMNAPKLWIVHESLVHKGITVVGSEMRMQPVGGTAAMRAVMGKQLSRGDYEIFEIDPVALDARFPGVDALKLHIVENPKISRLAGYYAPKEVLYLGQLRALLKQHLAALAAKPTSACVPTKETMPIEIDANKYTECTQQSSGENGHVTVSQWRYWWQYQVGAFGFLEGDRTIYSDESDEKFLAAMADPFRGPHGLYLRFVSKFDDKGRPLPLTIVMTADTVRYEFETKQGQAKLDREAVLRLDATAVPIRVVGTGAGGKTLFDTELPAGLFSIAATDLKAASAKLNEAQKNSIKNCAPETSIIVT